MAEQIFNITSGFFNAVNNDRTYSADDMNKPYKRVVSDGVFATPAGTPSTDFQVVENSGMIINVSPGNAIVASKWMESSVITPITVPANTSLSTRVDGVFIQIDNNTRTGNIVYKSGNIIPDTNGKTEYLVARVSVAAGATSITQSSITDMRGTTSCPWVTGLIQQVDTSALFDQYQRAFAEQFAAFEQQVDQNINNANTEWAQALEDLSGELTVSTNIITATSFYTASGDVTTIPINIAGYDSATDLLLVYINGLCAPSSYYTISGSDIVLTNAIHDGDTVLFVCFKALINGSIASATVLISELQGDVSQMMSDTGWQNITLRHGTAGDVAPSCRSIGGRVNMTGELVADSSVSGGTFIASIPYASAPVTDVYFTVPLWHLGAFSSAYLRIDNGGSCYIFGSITSGDKIYLDCSFLSRNAVGSTSMMQNADSMQF